MIPNKEKESWHYLAVKKTICITKMITSTHNDGFSRLNRIHSFRTGNKLKFHEKVYKNKYFCGIVMTLKNDNILEFNHYMKLDKMSDIVYADMQSLMNI